MATADEILATMSAEEEKAYLVIESDLRTITIPDEIKILGVESDDDVLRLHFKMPKMYGEFDLSEFELRVNYLNAGNEPDLYEVKDAAVSGDVIEFSWLVGRTAAKFKGDVKFIVCAKLIKADGVVEKEFNTTTAKLPVLEGLETSEAVVQLHPDIIEAILLRLSKLETSGGITDEQIANALSEYLAENPVQPGATQEQADQIQANKEAIEELQKNGTGGGITAETDPTVPAWAKQPSKPTYTASEVGALPATTQIPTVPETLPNPQPIVINGVSYDGSVRKEITVVSITDITLGKHTDGLIYIFIGGQPVGDGLEITGGSIVEPVYGQPTTDNALLKMVQNSTAMLGVKLDAEPTLNQTVTVSNTDGVLTFDKEVLEFTPENWNVYQFVTVTAGTVEDGVTTNIVLRNSDKLMTDSVIPVYVVAEGYAVDTTIPDGAHVVTADDFETLTPTGSSIGLLGYKGDYTNIFVPRTVEVDGVVKNTIINTNSFKDTAIQYATIESGTYVTQNGVNERVGLWNAIFKGCTNLIGVKYDGSDITTLFECFSGCTSLKFFDGLEKQINCTSLQQTFVNCSALEYVQDFSALTKITSLGQVFNGCSSLKRVFGLPSPEAACTWNMAFFNCGQLAQNIEVPEKASDIKFAFTNDANLRHVTINNDNLTSSEINEGTFRGCKELSVYAKEESTTYETLLDIYGASADVTIKDISGLSAPLIVTWGDSTTSTDTGWTMYFKDKVEGYAVNNQAVSGEFTTSTSARQGGNALTVGAFTIPADVSQTEITLTSADGQTFKPAGPRFSAGASFNPCTVAGVKGVITGGNINYFTRLNAGESVEVSDQTAVVSDADDLLNNANNVMLIDLGTNSGWNFDADILLNQVQLMVDHFTAKGGTKYIICGASSGKHLNGEDNMAIWLKYEQKAATAFGDHWLNMREYLIQNGLTENGLTATALDNERMAQGLIPASLLVGPILSDGVTLEDDTHPNAYGHNSKSNAFYNKGVELGYWG